jgi:hypothetical protein
MRRIAISVLVLCAALFGAQHQPSAFTKSGAGCSTPGLNISIDFCNGGGSSLTWNNPGSGNSCVFTGTPTLPFACGSLNFGTATSDRVIVACFAINGAAPASNANVSAVSTQSGAINFTPGPSGSAAVNARYTSIWYANVPTGTTGQTITWTTTGGNGWVTGGVMMIAYLTGSAGASVASSNISSPPAYPSSNVNAGSVTVSAGQLAALCGISTSSPGPASSAWTGAQAAPDVEVINAGNDMGTLNHATATGTVTETVSGNGAGASGWISATFKP